MLFITAGHYVKQILHISEIYVLDNVYCKKSKYNNYKCLIKLFNS